MSETLEKLTKKVEAMETLFRKLLSRGGGKVDLNLSVEELIVNVRHSGDRTVDVSTANSNGRILFCALKDLEKGSQFTEADMSAVLKERGWGMGHSTLSPALSQLAKDNLLIKNTKTRPMQYRLPSKISFRGEEL